MPLGCSVERRLEEEAGDTEVAEVTELNHDIVRMLDSAGDQEYTVALDYSLDPRPTAYQWSELAERHEETSRAQEAFEWWLANRGVLTVSDVQPLAEAVAAIQQRFNRLLFRIGARDPFQQQLFDDLRAWAKEAQCYLYSLRPKVPIAELVEKAGQLEAAWEQARMPVADARETPEGDRRTCCACQRTKLWRGYGPRRGATYRNSLAMPSGTGARLRPQTSGYGLAVGRTH